MQRTVKLAVILAVIVAAMLVAYQVGYHSATAKVAVPATTEAGERATPAPDGKTGSAGERFETFWETWRLVEQEYYDKDAIDYQKMTYGAIKGMLDALGDANTVFADPSHARMSEQDMRGSFDGIGVTVEMKDKRLTVVAPLEDSPGAKAGLRPGDVITMVDDRDTGGLTILEAVSLIRGPRGTAVRLAVEREGEPAPLTFQIVRAEIKIVTVRGEMKDGQIAYVRITQFSEPTARLLQQKLKELMDQKPRALILDLRNNPGGLLSSSVEVASQFIGDGVLLYEQRRDTTQQVFNARRGGLATSVPIVVLVNKGSASASEIVAGALQDRGRGVLIGEPTFGKDTVQNVHELGDKSSVRITIAKWYTPNRQDISGTGLKPDVEVRISEDDLTAGRDPQLERALERAMTGN